MIDRPCQPAPRQPARLRPRGFALPLVALLAVLAGIAVTLLLDRQGYSRLAVKRQELNYQSHHMLAGMKELIEFWLMIFKRPPDAMRPDSVIGFDMLTEDGYRLEIRLTDTQGSVLRSGDGLDATYGDIAAMILRDWGMDTSVNVRMRGPAKVSIHSASPEVLQALALAIDPKAQAQTFADAVVQKRQSARIVEGDLPVLLAKAGMQEDDRNILQISFTTDPSFWLVVVTVRSRDGTIVDRQGGLAVGTLRSSLGGTGGWTMLTWGPLSTEPEPALSPPPQ